jgi:hypothetical protein
VEDDDLLQIATTDEEMSALMASIKDDDPSLKSSNDDPPLKSSLKRPENTVRLSGTTKPKGAVSFDKSQPSTSGSRRRLESPKPKPQETRKVSAVRASRVEVPRKKPVKKSPDFLKKLTKKQLDELKEYLMSQEQPDDTTAADADAKKKSK